MTEIRGDYDASAKRPASRALDAICTAQWLITEDWLQTIVAIADRSQSDLQAVLAARGEPLANTESVVMRDGVAVVPVRGPIMRYANLFTQVSGATSLETLATDFGQAVANPAVKAIVLEIDSPGGMAAGISEFAAQVRAASKVKPVVAYVSDMGASAAYWIAAAAPTVVMSDTARVGSIGVVMQAMRSSEDGTIKVISSQSPLKQARPDSESGQRLYQQMVDQQAQVFVEAVAAYRGVTPERVMSDFGQGFVLVGASAVAAGMADRLGTLESIIAGLSGDNRMRKLTMNITRETIEAEHPDIAKSISLVALATATAASIDAENPAAALALRNEGAAAERARIKGVQECSLPGHEALVATMMFDGVTTPGEAALAVNKAARETLAAQMTGITTDAAQLAGIKHAPAPAASAASDLAALPLEERCKAEYERDASIRADFPSLSAYIADQKALANGSLRIIGKRGE